jgi:hypothetical protein
MNVASAIQSSANVIRITQVKAGDVYKRFEDNSDDSVYYGVVRNIHNDGVNTIIEATEYRYRYSTLSVDLKIIRGTKDYVIFPATPEDLNLELEKALTDQRRKITNAEDDIKKANKLIIDIEGLISGETQKQLTSMSYKELSQSQYNELQAQISM